MYTYQMVGLADQNGRTYSSKYGIYSKEKGFIIKPQYISFSKDIEPDKILFSYQELINGLFHDDCWKLKVEKTKPKMMTKEEIEKELGYEIEICDSEPINEDEVSKDLYPMNFESLLESYKNMFADDRFVSILNSLK